MSESSVTIENIIVFYLSINNPAMDLKTFIQTMQNSIEDVKIDWINGTFLTPKFNELNVQDFNTYIQESIKNDCLRSGLVELRFQDLTPETLDMVVNIIDTKNLDIPDSRKNINTYMQEYKVKKLIREKDAEIERLRADSETLKKVREQMAKLNV